MVYNYRSMSMILCTIRNLLHKINAVHLHINYKFQQASVRSVIHTDVGLLWSQFGLCGISYYIQMATRRRMCMLSNIYIQKQSLSQIYVTSRFVVMLTVSINSSNSKKVLHMKNKTIAPPIITRVRIKGVTARCSEGPLVRI